MGWLSTLAWLSTCGCCGSLEEESKQAPAAELRSPLLANGYRARRSTDKLGRASLASPPPQHPPVDNTNILGLGHRDVVEDYELGALLGEGAFGVVRRCRNRRTGGAFACKSVVKAKLRRRADVEDVRREVQILMMLSSHPNVAALVATYEDPTSVHLILELCEGGQLLDHICAQCHVTERSLARHFRKMVEVVHHCHTLGIAHRDIKPENFLISSPGPDAEVKAADFGLSQFFRYGKNLHSLVGSAYYVAPEVLRREYGPKADIWSLGVCLYILLSGIPPFWGDCEEDVFAMILHGDVDYAADPFPALSPQALDILKQMLDRDVGSRPSAQQLLQHAWLRQAAPDRELGGLVIPRLRGFATMAQTQTQRAAGIGEDGAPAAPDGGDPGRRDTEDEAASQRSVAA